MLELTATETKFAVSGEELRVLQADYETNHQIKLSQFINHALLDELHSALRAARFYTRKHTELSVEECMEANQLYAALQLMMNDQMLFDAVEQITGCPPIGCFIGRAFRFLPGAKHYDSWHDDNINTRMVGLTLNLTEKEYSGGALEFRNRHTEQALSSILNTGFGDAFLFRISEDLQHRGGSVTGKVPRVTYAGWFQAEPSFEELEQDNLKGEDLEKLSEAVVDTEELEELSNAQLKIKPGIVTRQRREKTLVIDLRGSGFLELDWVASLVWQTLVSGHGISAATRAVTDEYHIDSTTAEADCRQLVARLYKLNLLEFV